MTDETQENGVGLMIKTINALEGKAGIVSAQKESVVRISLTSDSDTNMARLNIAEFVLGALGEEVLSDNIEVILNGTSLTDELMDVVCSPLVIQLV